VYKGPFPPGPGVWYVMNGPCGGTAGVFGVGELGGLGFGRAAFVKLPKLETGTGLLDVIWLLRLEIDSQS